MANNNPYEKFGFADEDEQAVPVDTGPTAALAPQEPPIAPAGTPPEEMAAPTPEAVPEFDATDPGMRAPAASIYDRFGFAEPLPEPEPEEEPPGMWSNAFRRMGERTVQLGGRLLRTASRVATAPERIIRNISEEEMLEMENVGVDYRTLVETIPNAMIGVDLGADETVGNPEQIKQAWENGDYSEVAKNTGRFIVETGIESIPDMIATVFTLPLYIAARSDEMTETKLVNQKIEERRSEIRNQLKDQPNPPKGEELERQVDQRLAQHGTPEIGVEDMPAGEQVKMLPFTVLTALLERTGAVVIGKAGKTSREALEQMAKEASESGMKRVAREAGKGATVEATTEFYQEGVVEYFAENFGISPEGLFATMDPLAAAERGGWGALAGGGFGGTAAGGVATVREFTQRGERQELAEAASAQLNALDQIEAAQREAEERAAAAGGDALDQAQAGADAAEEVGAALRVDFTARAEETVRAEEEAAGIAQQTAERFTREAEARYQQEQAYAQREAEKTAQREQEAREAEYQRELDRGAGTEAVEAAERVQGPAAAATLGEAAPELGALKQRRQAEKAKRKEAERIRKEAKEAAEVPLLQDQRPTTVVVDPAGEARRLTADELESQVKRRWDATEQLEMEFPDGSTRRPDIPVKVEGLDIRIENPKGTTRKGRDKDGKTWSMKLQDAHYGKIRGLRGADNESIDVFVGPKTAEITGESNVFVIDQYTPDGTFDEHKVMVGFPNEVAAIRAYEKNNKGGMKRGGVSSMSLNKFKGSVMKNSRLTEPLRPKDAPAPPAEPATEADVEAIAERQQRRRGRRRGRIQYRLPDETTAEPVVPGFRDETDLPDWDDAMKKPDYFREKKNTEVHRTTMTPQAYIEAAAAGFGRSVAEIRRQRQGPLIDEYAQAMKEGAQFPRLTLDYKGGFSQEGLHRAIAAEKAGLDTVPVAVRREAGTLQGQHLLRGGKRKVLYSLGDAEIAVRTEEDGISRFSEEISRDTLPEETVYVSASKGGRVVGEMAILRRGDNLQIVQTKVDSGFRGEGIGQQLILEAVRYANQQGFELVSDTSVSVAQLRAYEALRRRGDLVVEYNAAGTVQEALRTMDPEDSVVMDVPVVRRMIIPEYVEEIQYRRPTREEIENEDQSEEEKLRASEELIDGLVEQMPGLDRSKVHVVRYPHAAGPGVFGQMQRDGQMDAEGVHDSRTGEIYIFTGNLRSPARAVEVFLHEAVGHYGLRSMLGDGLDPLLDDIYQNGDRRAIAAIARRYGLDLANTEDQRLAAEEYVAHMAETAQDSTLLQRVVDAVRKFLRNAGLLDTWTDSDILALLTDVRRNLRHRPLDQIQIEEGVTADVALRRFEKRTAALARLRDCVR